MGRPMNSAHQGSRKVGLHGARSVQMLRRRRQTGTADIRFVSPWVRCLKETRRDGQKLVKALSHGGAVASSNKALPFVKGWTSANGRTAMAPTLRPSVRLLAEEAHLSPAGRAKGRAR